MFVAYGTLGLIANIALAANVALIIAILSVLGATLTLPGIAGIVLTIGMAVDSNVLIYERVREERRHGRSLVQSLDPASRAPGDHRRRQLHDLIAAVDPVLSRLRAGASGFAVTLAIGIVTTVFTAFTLTRWLIVDLAAPLPAEGTAARAWSRFVPDDTTIPFMSLRRYAFALSAVLSIASVVLFFTVDMNYGIDFHGGSIIEVQAKGGAADPATSATRLSELNSAKCRCRNSARRATC